MVPHRRQQRRAEKARRHLQPSSTEQPSRSTEPSATPKATRVVVQPASSVERLAYTRSQAAQALGISRSTLRRLLPYVETIEMPWGGKLIPVDELERLVAERRRAASVRPPAVKPGRKPSVPPDVVERIQVARASGRSLRQIASDLNAEGTPTGHGGTRWWPSTVRAVLQRATPGSSAARVPLVPTYTDRAMAHTRSSELGPAARPVAVPDDLDDPSLAKASGRIELPFHIRWSGPPITYDVDDRANRVRVYEQVLREGTEDDVRYYVDADQLRDLWDELVLPPAVRQAWAGWFRRHRRVA